MNSKTATRAAESAAATSDPTAAAGFNRQPSRLVEATAPLTAGWLTLQHLLFPGRWSAAVSWQYGPFVIRAFMRWTKRGFGSGAPAHGKTPAAPDILPKTPCCRVSTSAIPVSRLVPGRKRLTTVSLFVTTPAADGGVDLARGPVRSGRVYRSRSLRIFDEDLQFSLLTIPFSPR